MQKTVSLFLAVVMLLAGTLEAWAGGCHVPFYRPAYVAPVVQVVKEVVFVPTPIVQAVFSVPQVSVAVPVAPVAPVAPAIAPVGAPRPPQALGGPTPCDAKIAALEAKLAAMEASIIATRKQPEPIPGKPQYGPGKMALIKRCASCHEASVSFEKGDRFTLLTKTETGYDFAELNQGEQNSMYKQLLSKRMPKNDKLEGDEGAALIQYVADSQWSKKE